MPETIDRDRLRTGLPLDDARIEALTAFLRALTDRRYEALLPPCRAMTESQRGVLLALIAGLVWGLAPLYFRWVGAASPLEIVLHRVLWSVPMLAIAMTLMRRWPHVAPVIHDRRKLRVLIVTASLITANWFVSCTR